MHPDPLFIEELRSLFKAGTTPSALIRRIAERHPDEPALDRLVRAYFREAFSVPMLQIGREQVERIARGGELPSLNGRVVHRMVAARSDWDVPPDPHGPRPTCWLDSVTATGEAELLKAVELGTRSEAVGGWEHLDDEARRFITRTVANARSLHETVQVLAALAERLQQQLHAAESVPTRTA